MTKFGDVVRVGDVLIVVVAGKAESETGEGCECGAPHDPRRARRMTPVIESERCRRLPAAPPRVGGGDR